MKNTIAESIIIRVGQGIMSIPRVIEETEKNENPINELEQLKESLESKEPVTNDSDLVK